MISSATIPTHDATGVLARRLAEIKNVVAMTQPSFHQTLLDTWHALGKPPLFQIHFAFGPIVFIADPVLADRVIRDTGKVRHSHEEAPQAGDFDKSRLTRGLGGEEGPAGVYGIFAISNMEVYGKGELTYHEIQQYLIPAFGKAALMKYSTTMVAKARDLVNQFPTQGTFDLVPYLNMLNLNTITQTMMSIEWNSQEDIDHLMRFLRDGSKNAATRAMIGNESLLNAMQLFSQFFPQTIPNQKAYLLDREWLYEKVVNRIFVQRLEGVRRAAADHTEVQSSDMLGHLIKSLLEAQAADPRYTDEVIAEVIQSQIATFLIAGQETSTSLETSIFHYILRPENRAIYQRIKDELAAVVGDRPPTYDDMANLPFLHAVINYVMAFNPPVFIIPRETLRPVELGGYTIPAQTQVFPSPLMANRMLLPELETRGPEMFLEPDMNEVFYHKVLTFGKGKRSCIGERFAHLATVMHCATLFQAVDFTFVSADAEGKSGLVPYRTTGQLNVSVTPAH